jgi:hypothetical protein
VDKCCDWQVLDKLTRLSPRELTRLLRHVSVRATADEASAYCAAACAYILGDCTSAAEHLRVCLQFDPDVEEYWHLLAFSNRHTGDYEAAGSILFGGRRDLVGLPRSGGA